MNDRRSIDNCSGGRLGGLRSQEISESSRDVQVDPMTGVSFYSLTMSAGAALLQCWSHRPYRRHAAGGRT